MHMNDAKYDSDTPTARIGRFVSEYFDIPFVHDVYSAEAVPLHNDIVFLLPGVLLFCGFRERAFKLLENAKAVVHLQNDFSLDIDNRIMKIIKTKFFRWTTTPYFISGPGDLFVNWNQLTWEDLPLGTPKKEGLLYYGAYRPNRVKYFAKYLTSDLYPIHVTCYMRNHVLYKALNPKINIYKPFSHALQLRAMQSTIYIEDEWTNQNYCCPANRFYECLYLGIAIFFDKSCCNTFNQAGYDISEFVVDSDKQLAKKLGDWDKVRKRQRQLWHKDYFEQLINHMNENSDKAIKEILDVSNRNSNSK